MAEARVEQLGQLANHEIVTLALYLLGGEARKVDTEDVAKKSNEWATNGFTPVSLTIALFVQATSPALAGPIMSAYRKPRSPRRQPGVATPPPSA